MVWYFNATKKDIKKTHINTKQYNKDIAKQYETPLQNNTRHHNIIGLSTKFTWKNIKQNI